MIQARQEAALDSGGVEVGRSLAFDDAVEPPVLPVVLSERWCCRAST